MAKSKKEGSAAAASADETTVSPAEASTPVIDDAATDPFPEADLLPAIEPGAGALDDEFGEDAPNDKEPQVPTFDEYTEAGYDASGYHKRFGRNPKPNSERAKREAVQAAASTAAAVMREKAAHVGKAMYVVWEYGSLHCNGVLTEPGGLVDLTFAQAEAIGECVSLAV
jgi:hypothetical protein